MIPQNFTNKAQEALQNAIRIANENGQPQIEPQHLFISLLEDHEGIVVSVLQKLNASLNTLKEQVQKLIDRLPKQMGQFPSGGQGQIMLGQAMMYVLQNAAQEAKKMGDEYISVEHLLLAFLTSKNPINELVGQQKVNYEAVLKILADIRGSQKVDSPEPESKYNALIKY